MLRISTARTRVSSLTHLTRPRVDRSRSRSIDSEEMSPQEPDHLDHLVPNSQEQISLELRRRAVFTSGRSSTTTGTRPPGKGMRKSSWTSIRKSASLSIQERGRLSDDDEEMGRGEPW
jgi:hypothetical protein